LITENNYNEKILSFEFLLVRKKVRDFKSTENCLLKFYSTPFRMKTLFIIIILKVLAVLAQDETTSDKAGRKVNLAKMFREIDKARSVR
jgi:hypothetical protein